VLNRVLFLRTGGVYELTDGVECDAPGLAGQPDPQRVGQAAAEAGRGDIGIEDDEAHARPERRDAYRSARNSSQSWSESNSPGRAISSTEVIGPIPWRRASSSTGTSPAASGAAAGSLCSDDMITTSLAFSFSHDQRCIRWKTQPRRLAVFSTRFRCSRLPDLIVRVPPDPPRRLWHRDHRSTIASMVSRREGRTVAQSARSALRVQGSRSGLSPACGAWRRRVCQGRAER